MISYDSENDMVVSQHRRRGSVCGSKGLESSPSYISYFFGYFGYFGYKNLDYSICNDFHIFCIYFSWGLLSFRGLSQPSKVPSERDVAVEKPDRRQEDTPETQMASCRKWGSRFLIRNRYHLCCTARNS